MRSMSLAVLYCYICNKFLMMNRVITFLFLLIVANSCSYTVGSGNIVTEKRSVEIFEQLSVSGPFEVQVKIGTAYEVMVQADDNIIKYIETTVSNKKLKIRTENLHNFSNVTMKIYITTPFLSSVKASAAANVVILDVLKSSKKLVFTTSSAAEIVSEVKAPEIQNIASSGSLIKLSGKTKNYYAEASSGADIKTGNLLSENTTVSASSGASIKAYASFNLKATASSGADIIYTGSAAVNKTTSSGGSIEKYN